MIVSPFTPLSFAEFKSDGAECPYIQTFATTDHILIEMLGTAVTSCEAHVYSEPDHILLFDINWNDWVINDNAYLKFTTLILSEGFYSVEIEGVGTSDVFRVTADECILSDTTLIQYSMKNNRQRTDAVFFIDGMQHFFDFRVPGGFKHNGWSFAVDNENFTTQLSDIMQLYARESTQKKFTMGTSDGCPVWFGEMLNRLLCCNYVYFDGVRYARVESNSPEPTEQLEGSNSFVFAQLLQQVTNLDPVLESNNQAVMRRVDSSTYRTIDKDSETYNLLTN